MKLLIVDDDFSIHRILTMIIEHDNLGQVIKNEDLDGRNILQIIEKEMPNIIIVDLLMPGKDGIEIVREVRAKYKDIMMIMISQVNSKDMIEKAYSSGIEFFINKPINAVEVKSVLLRVINEILMKEKLRKIQNLLQVDGINQQPMVKNYKEVSKEQKIKDVMKTIGILGEGGEEDIILALKYMIDNEGILDKCTLNEFFNKISCKPKSAEQRIRRTAIMAINNIANLGVEDYMNEVFNEFSTSLFSFDEVKREMDYIRGKSSERGKINVKKFLQGMLYYVSK